MLIVCTGAAVVEPFGDGGEDDDELLLQPAAVARTIAVAADAKASFR
jgi:hypothetical protein